MKVNIDPTAPTFATYRRDMRAEQMAEDYPVVSIDSDALDAARMLAEHRLPGLLVTAGAGKQYAVLPPTGRALHRAPLCARRSLTGRCAQRIDGRPVRREIERQKVRDVLPDHLVEVPRLTPTTPSSRWPR